MGTAELVVDIVVVVVVVVVGSALENSRALSVIRALSRQHMSRTRLLSITQHSSPASM
jgi:nicotinamide mononucleotide adenylyltransferase